MCNRDYFLTDEKDRHVRVCRFYDLGVRNCIKCWIKGKGYQHSWTMSKLNCDERILEKSSTYHDFLASIERDSE